MNDQEIFDTVAAHLLAQGARSFLEGSGTCAYRGAGGLCCAVGCLIPDDRYHASLEGGGVSRPAVLDALPWDVSADQVGLLKRLQEVHDLTEVKDWRAGLLRLAEARSLVPGAVDE